jgi:hypothetical protein
MGKSNNVRFDQKSLQALKPTGEKVNITDPQTPGFYFRMSEAGAKIYSMV